MDEILKIGKITYQKTSGVFEILFTKLGQLRFCDLPYYSTIELVGLPGNTEDYNLNPVVA